MIIRDWIRCISLTVYGKISTVAGGSPYEAIPVGEISPSMPAVTLIYDFLPTSPIPVEVGGRVNEKWTFPEDFILQRTHPGGSYVALASDVNGSFKMYEYHEPSHTILLNSGWGFTVTAEGSIVIHGPKNDPRSEICILLPFGWQLMGIPVGDTLSVTQRRTFTTGNWQDDGYSWQSFTILYNTDDNPKLIQQEVTWDTDTLAPCLKTTYPQEHIHRYDIKAFQAYWYQATSAVDVIPVYAPCPVFEGAKSVMAQTRVCQNMLDELKTKYASESSSFDAYRNPDLVPE